MNKLERFCLGLASSVIALVIVGIKVGDWRRSAEHRKAMRLLKERQSGAVNVSAWPEGAQARFFQDFGRVNR